MIDFFQQHIIEDMFQHQFGLKAKIKREPSRVFITWEALDDKAQPVQVSDLRDSLELCLRNMDVSATVSANRFYKRLVVNLWE